jgi:hypothetical protein
MHWLVICICSLLGRVAVTGPGVFKPVRGDWCRGRGDFADGVVKCLHVRGGEV